MSDLNFGAEVLWVSKVKLPARWGTKPHHHEFYHLTYVVSGRFRFTVGDTAYEVKAGDTLLKTDGVIHGCVALEGGVLLDIFNPMREDFVK